MCLLFSGFSPVYLNEACAVYSGITRRARFLEGGDSLIGRGAGGDGCPITNGNTSHALNTHYKTRLGLLAEGHASACRRRRARICGQRNLTKYHQSGGIWMVVV